MRKITDWLVIIFFCAFPPISSAATNTHLPDTVLNELRLAGIPGESVGVYVESISGGTLAVRHNAAEGLNPASTMKLVTTYAALELLGPAYIWKTRVYETGVRRGGILYGDLFLLGSGAPDLSLEQFWRMLRELRLHGLRDIRGKLMLDRSRFAPVEHDAAAFDDDPTRPYNAGPDALLLNGRTLRLRFSPDPAGQRVAVAMEPLLKGVTLEAPSLGTGACQEWRKKLRIDIDGKAVRIQGEYPEACGEQESIIYAHSMEANRYLAGLFGQLWTELGGAFRGDVQDGAVPPGARLVSELDSEPLALVVRDINKFSNNVMARQLLLTIAAEFGGMPATPETGGRIVKRWLQSKGVPAHELIMENGAGLSRTERIAAGTLGQMLVAAYGSPVMADFVASMPLLGQDGTLRRRMRQEDIAGHAQLKTGLLRDVRSVAGYVLAASGRRYAIAFLVNHPEASRSVAAQDALLQWVYRNG